ncbi:condensation domain-containing protein [Paenibacillus rhizoplanae]
MHKAFRTVVKQQEVLRSKFKGGQGQLEVELSEDSEEPVFKRYDCSQAGMEISPDDIRQRMYTEGIQPFRLAEGKLIRLICYKLSETEWIGQIVWHHIVSDGYSSGIFLLENYFNCMKPMQTQAWHLYRNPLCNIMIMSST